MTKRFTIKPQDDLFGVVDNYSPDKVCVINGIRTAIEAKWLCKDMNALNNENEQLKEDVKYFNETYSVQEYGLDIETHVQLSSSIPSRKELLKENERLKQSVNNLKETILKITIAYQRKYDRTIVKLVHEVHDEDISVLIKELIEHEF